MISPMVFCSRRSATRERCRTRSNRRRSAPRSREDWGSIPCQRDCAGIEAAVVSRLSIPALSFDLTFPEVFYPFGMPNGRHGFHAVLGNPPWDALQPLAKEFFASFDFEILSAPTGKERAAIEESLIVDSQVKMDYENYINNIVSYKRFLIYTLLSVNKQAGGRSSGAVTDLWQCFAERSTHLARVGGYVGIVVPSAFHANEGATGIRELYLYRMQTKFCYSFENRRKLFEIHRSFKFACLVAVRSQQPTMHFQCAFYLHDDSWLFATERDVLTYSLEFVQRTGGEYLSFLELRSSEGFDIASACYLNCESLGSLATRVGIELGRGLDTTRETSRFIPIPLDSTAEFTDYHPSNKAARDYLVLHEGKTFRQYDDRWLRPRYIVPFARIQDRPDFLRHACYYRLGHRKIAGPGDENVSIWTLHTPGIIFGDSCPGENTPRRPNSTALALLAILNSSVFDFLLSMRVRANVLAFMRDAQPVPPYRNGEFLAHSALRLTCNHRGYDPLWREQLGHAWREPDRQLYTCPVLSGEDDRWAVRCAIDAVVADAYGLARHQYSYVLSTFSHASYPKALDLCLANFDELKTVGLDAFTKKHDPYWDIPLNENLPQPVIDLPIPKSPNGSDQMSLFGEIASDSPKNRKASRKAK